MSDAILVGFPERSERDKNAVAAVGFPEGLEKASWYFSLFLLVFPPIAIGGTYITEKTILLSLPLILMAVCGAFGMKLSLHLERTK